MSGKTGGCQCGYTRYRLDGEPSEPSICHCRMCQKAFGNYFAPLVGLKTKELVWTRGEPKTFRSSETVERGFCSRCGTPLTYHEILTERICVSLGSLDDPTAIKPEKAWGTESKMPWFDELSDLPSYKTEDAITEDKITRLISRQHPDHDSES